MFRQCNKRYLSIFETPSLFYCSYQSQQALVYFLSKRNFGILWPVLAISSWINALFGVLFTGLKSAVVYHNCQISGLFSPRICCFWGGAWIWTGCMYYEAHEWGGATTLLRFINLAGDKFVKLRTQLKSLDFVKTFRFIRVSYKELAERNISSTVHPVRISEAVC